MDPTRTDKGGRPPMVRPFLNRSLETPTTAPPDLSPTTIGVRAYMMTGGRTGAGAVRLEFEAMLTLSERGKGTVQSLAFERRKIADLCGDTAQSVAELAAKLHIPLGVAQVVAGDMVGDGLLSLHQAKTNLSDDIAMIKRLIQGVRAL